MNSKGISIRVFGGTGIEVTRVGLGGEGVLRTRGREAEAREVILEALEQGITYFDSARAYADSEVYLGSLWGEFPEKRARIFQASKSASRDRAGALSDLENTLRRMRTGYLDLWQIHDVRTVKDLERISGPGGALEAFVEAKTAGKVRFIGVTGHQDPAVLTQAVREWPVDAVLLPVNPVEGVLGGFLTETLAAAEEKGIAVIGMKVMGASHYIREEWEVTPELLLRYALSFDITLPIVGCSTPEEVRTLATAGREAKPVSDEERARLEGLFKPHADGLAYYRGVV